MTGQECETKRGFGVRGQFRVELKEELRLTS